MAEDLKDSNEAGFTAGTNEYAQLSTERDAESNDEREAGTKAYNDVMSARKAVYEAGRAEFKQGLEPSVESPKFAAEMAEPRMIQDPETGLNYAVYQVNTDKEGTPLVVNLAWSVPAGEGVGRADVHEFSTHLPDRPILVVDMVATGKTEVPDRAARKDMNFEDLSAAHLRVIDQAIGADTKFDVSGYSLGGVMAAGIAAQAGDRVGNVITTAAPGFEDISLVELGKGFALQEGKNAGVYRDLAKVERPTVHAQDQEAQANTKGTITLHNAPALIRLAGLMTKEATADAIRRLDPSTKWTDIVGSKDAVSDWTGHLEAVRERNAAHPRSSTEHVLGSETHGVGMHRPAMAEAVAITLTKPGRTAPEGPDGDKRLVDAGHWPRDVQTDQAPPATAAGDEKLSWFGRLRRNGREKKTK
jgi:pimeloyl-ACP methyl ester carboxylesterase